MIEVRLPDTKQRRLPYYLSLEEWVATNLPPDDYIFAWRVPPTVICGRNQDMPLEVNLSYCRANGIDVVRRRSGGGCVYADMNNYMFSYITAGNDVEANFARYAAITAEMLRSLGLRAEASGRNDILVDGAKIAGNAFYLVNGRSIAHGTMLFDVDNERMLNAITPSRAKLQSKAVQSVQKRVTCLRTLGIDMSVEEFGKYAIDYFTGGKSITLTERQQAELDAIEKRYYSAEFLYGRLRSKENDSLIRHFSRIDGVGEFYAETELAPDRTIAAFLLSGDFFFTGDITDRIEKRMVGCPYDWQSVLERLREINPGAIIRGATPEALVEIII